MEYALLESSKHLNLYGLHMYVCIYPFGMIRMIYKDKPYES